jgi:GNAT superfamily N-acetyltransferase
MSSRYVVQRARVGDCEALTALAHAAKQHWNYPEDYMRLWRHDLTVTTELVRDHAVYVAAAGDEIVGFYALRTTLPVFDLEHFWVKPARMRQGIGRLLFAHALETARAGGATSIDITSDPHARGFYERMGARPIGDEPGMPAGRMLPVLRIDVR